MTLVSIADEDIFDVSADMYSSVSIIRFFIFFRNQITKPQYRFLQHAGMLQNFQKQ